MADEIVAAVEGWKRAADRKSEKLEGKVDDVRALVQRLAVKLAEDFGALQTQIAEELGERRAADAFIRAVLEAVEGVGTLKGKVATLEIQAKNQTKWYAVYGTVILGQWAAIIALWKALP